MNDADAVLPLPAVPPTNGDTDRHVEPSLKPAEIKIPPPVTSPSEKQKAEQEDDGGNDGSDDVVSVKADSEAETIIQSGREELSPEKKKRIIQHKRDRSPARGEDDRDSGIASLSEGGKPRKRLRVENDNVDGKPVAARDGSGRSSRVSSPAQEMKPKQAENSERPSATRGLSHSRSDGVESNKCRAATKRWSSEGITRTEEGETRRHRDRQHASDSSHNKSSDETTKISHTRHLSNRSISPAYRSHHRVSSGSHSSIDPKKRRRPPPPLATDPRRQVSEDRESVSSSASGSPLPSARLRKLVSGEQAATSPAKQMVKKQRDQNGRTRLARACAMQEVEVAKQRHNERPEDLNIPDNAGNTPLQIAALEGCAEIVKFLIEAGCEIDTKNIDRDTPLIDAVENGHLEVVKLLLDAGANPRLGNAEGDEPYDLIPSDNENYEDLRRIIAEAKAKGPRRRKSTDQSVRATSSVRDPSSRGASAASPRDSPPVHNQRSPPPTGFGGRRRTVRSEATRNDLLWTKATPENLRDFAAKGDMAGVANILNVGTKADPESLIAAAKGGHDEVLGILLGMGDPDPDPEPLQTGNHNKPGYNTPMLAAIGRGNTEVIKLLLEQRGFDPTRLDRRGRTYYELSRERRGDHWEKEYDLLKQAYDNHMKTRKHRKPDTKSPRRAREKEVDAKRHARRESSSPVPSSQRKPSRPSDSNRQIERSPGETDPAREKRRSDGNSHEKDKRVPPVGNRTKPSHRENINRDQSGGGSDQETHLDRKKQPKDSIQSGHGEEPVKRRRLIAGRPPDRIQRRESLMSSDSLSGREESGKLRTERANLNVRPAKEGAPLKRSRSSVSPEPPQSRGRQHKDDDPRDIQKKRRRVQSEENGISSSNTIAKKTLDLPAPSSKTPQRRRNSNVPNPSHERSHGADSLAEKESSTAIKPKPASSTIKQEQRKSDSDIRDIPMEDVDRAQAEAKLLKEAREAEEAKERDAMEKEAREAREAREKEAREAKQAREAKEAQEAKEAKEAREKEAREFEQAREAREAEERRIAAQVERERLEEELREAKAAKEAQEAEEAREAAETAARLAREKAEEEERKRKELEARRLRQADEERQKRLEQERLRLARLRKEQEEHEQRRRDALPNRLRAAANLVGSNDPISKSHAWLKKFMPVVTATTKQIDPSCDDEIKDDRWIPNYLIAPLLATNDLQLSQYPSWEKRPATPTQRNNLWRVTRRILVEEGELNPLTTSVVDVMRKDAETRPKYFAMEHIFWVKYSDFMDLVPHIPHLHGLDIRTLRMHVDPEPDAQAAEAEPQLPNGIRSGTPILDSGAKSPLTNGFITPNGHAHF
ncbi:hypothetical protein AJ79_01213 [Helicocarpus griseus UAMH5409]|uniref:Uncharacterized protein n=1 Tax=Helicocarpus griseus UAMH5409 TaxID=1447875 RepID=A0A2B7Y8A4_9EURO|nr:hypothetical protein AJ79_01213 [Helicocarpus griseus UAMH5409]